MMFEEFIQVFIIGLLIFLPVSLIYKKAGFHTAWAALVFLPVLRFAAYFYAIGAGALA
jgi:NADH:ubiquinone oxidoreductase subunit 3 (subunit A)